MRPTGEFHVRILLKSRIIQIFTSPKLLASAPIVRMRLPTTSSYHPGQLGLATKTNTRLRHMAFWNKPKQPKMEYDTLLDAVDAGDIDAVRQMIRNGANVRGLNEHGAPPLQYAVARGHLDVAKLLVDHGADVNFLIEGGGTPLMGAASCLVPRSIEFLLSKGADPNKKGDGGRFPLACPYHGNLVTVDRQIECIRLLVAGGARVNERTDTGFTPLMKAAWFGNTQAAAELLRLGADPELRDSDGKTAAIIAFERGHDELAKLLKNTSTCS